VSVDLSELTAVAPAETRLQVVHVHGRSGAAEARRLAVYERSLGWDVAVVGLLAAPRRLRAPGVQVVALHGRRAGAFGRLLLRGSRTTVLVPAPGAWGAGRSLRGAVLDGWERLAARWTNAVLVTDPAEAALGVRRRMWVPPFVVGPSLELRAAALTRAHAFGRPSARQAPAAPSGSR
jgi:hypothetical protein